MTLSISPTALADMQQASDYYNDHATNLGHRFIAEVKEVFSLILKTPNGFAIRYKNVRAVKVKSFPFLVFYLVDAPHKSITVLRVFNSYREQYW